MSRPDEGLIHQWLDGECTPEESARIEALVARDPAWAAAVAEARGLIAASARIVSALDAVPGNVIPEGSRAAPTLGASRQPRGFRVRPWMRMAAGLVLVAGTLYGYGLRSADEPSVVAVEDVAATPAVGTSTSAEVVLGSVSAAAPAGTGLAQGVSAASRAAPAVVAPAVVPAAGAPARARAPIATDSDRYVAGDRLAEAAKAGHLQLRPAPETRGAAREQILGSPNSIARTAEEIERARTGCWRVVSPDSLAGVRRHPMLLRESADTLDLRIAAALTLRVLRGGDALPGPVTAQRVPCEPE